MPSYGRGSMKRAVRIALVALVMGGLATPAFAQTTGIINGIVTASTGLALPGATVTLRHAAGGPERTAQTQPDGTYLFTNLSVDGNYEVQVDLQGFTTVVHSGVS